MRLLNEIAPGFAHGFTTAADTVKTIVFGIGCL